MWKWWRNIEVDSLEIVKNPDEFEKFIKQRFAECDVSSVERRKDRIIYLRKNRWDSLAIRIKKDEVNEKTHLVIHRSWHASGCFYYFLGFMRWLQPFIIGNFEEETKESLCRNIYRKYETPTRFISPRQLTDKAWLSWLGVLVSAILMTLSISQGETISHNITGINNFVEYEPVENPVFNESGYKTVPAYVVTPDGKLRQQGTTQQFRSMYGFEGLTDAVFDYAENFENGYAVVKKDDKAAIINRSLKFIVPYDSLNRSAGTERISKDLTLISVNDKHGVINKDGKWIIPLKNIVISSLVHDVLEIYDSEQHTYTYTDHNGDKLNAFSNLTVFEKKTHMIQSLIWVLGVIAIFVVFWLTKKFAKLSYKQQALNLLFTIVCPTCVSDHDKHEYPNPMFNNPDNSDSDATLVSTETVQ